MRKIGIWSRKRNADLHAVVVLEHERHRVEAQLVHAQGGLPQLVELVRSGVVPRLPWTHVDPHLHDVEQGIDSLHGESACGGRAGHQDSFNLND